MSHGGTLLAPLSPPPRPKTGRPPKTGWYPTFLASMRATAAWWVSADAAGVDMKTVRRHMDVNPEFAERVDFAENLYFDNLAIRLVDDRFAYVGKIARLKTRRPEYNDKLVNVNLNLDADLSDGKAQEIVRELIASLRDGHEGSAVAAPLVSRETAAPLALPDGQAPASAPSAQVLDVTPEASPSERAATTRGGRRRRKRAHAS